MLIEYSADGVTWTTVHNDPAPLVPAQVLPLAPPMWTAFNAEPPPTFWRNFFGQHEQI